MEPISTAGGQQEPQKAQHGTTPAENGSHGNLPSTAGQPLARSSSLGSRATAMRVSTGASAAPAPAGVWFHPPPSVKILQDNNSSQPTATSSSAPPQSAQPSQSAPLPQPINFFDNESHAGLNLSTTGNLPSNLIVCSAADNTYQPAAAVALPPTGSLMSVEQAEALLTQSANAGADDQTLLMLAQATGLITLDEQGNAMLASEVTQQQQQQQQQQVGGFNSSILLSLVGTQGTMAGSLPGLVSFTSVPGSSGPLFTVAGKPLPGSPGPAKQHALYKVSLVLALEDSARG